MSEYPFMEKLAGDGAQQGDCNGDCCVAFKLPFTPMDLARGNVGDQDAEEARLISRMFIPLSVEGANARQEFYVRGEKTNFTEADEGYLYMCPHWDEATRKCGIYAHRPAGCRTFPYGKSCRYGCSCKGETPDPKVIIWMDHRVVLVGFTPNTREYLGIVLKEQFGHEIDSVSYPFESLAGLFFVLRAIPDREFPNGKWATIQQLEQLLEPEAIARALTGYA